ncbi:MAG: hypothetical protein KDA81_03040 [Planctomycetaceae bacterium]|nr:hypothetical protein [Planctomycetaceae bacterium]
MKFTPTSLSLAAVVDVFDQHDLFDTLDNEDVLRLSRLGGGEGFGTCQSIRKSTGISHRRILRQGMTAAEMAERICRRAAVSVGCDLQSFDAILLCHSHTDHQACQILADELAERCELDRSSIQAYNHGCAGFLKLMSQGAERLCYAPSGSRVLLLSVETPEYWHDAADRLFCGIVSAGATAAVMHHGAGIPISCLRSGDVAIPPEARINQAPLFRKDTTDVFDFRGTALRRTVMRMNSEPVFLNGIELMLSNLRSALAAANPQPGERVIVAPHQPSGKLLKALIAAAKAEFPGLEFLNNLESYGNTISSSVPTLLSRLHEVLNHNGLPAICEGDHVILLAAGICMSDIADQMSAGHACLTWQNLRPLPATRCYSDVVASVETLR